MRAADQPRHAMGQRQADDRIQDEARIAGDQRENGRADDQRNGGAGVAVIEDGGEHYRDAIADVYVVLDERASGTAAWDDRPDEGDHADRLQH